MEIRVGDKVIVKYQFIGDEEVTVTEIDEVTATATIEFKDGEKDWVGFEMMRLIDKD